MNLYRGTLAPHHYYFHIDISGTLAINSWKQLAGDVRNIIRTFKYYTINSYYINLCHLHAISWLKLGINVLLSMSWHLQTIASMNQPYVLKTCECVLIDGTSGKVIANFHVMYNSFKDLIDLIVTMKQFVSDSRETWK